MANQYHEPATELSPQDRDYVRALMSLKEEVEAVDWYHQRVATCADPQLRAILAHNRDEEIEHAVMALEWLRRSMPGWDEQLRTYLFTTGDITTLEESATAVQAPGESAPAAEAKPTDKTTAKPGQAKPSLQAGLGIGSLKGK